ncbi:MAG: DUF6077 domain-containing protein [Eubacteriales bacterium]|nr:DUF6077 domain-containing protein [Eubacteriales bacterium]
MIFVTLHVHDDGDDAWYVGTAVVSYFTNTINRISPYTGEWMSSLPPDYTLSPWPVFCAVLGKLSRCHPAIIMHTFVPIIFIPMAYAVYAMIAAKLFDGNKEKVSWFLLFLCMINIFGYWSIRSTSTFLLFRIWQGKAILCNIIIPAVIYMFMDFVEEAEHKKTDKLMKLFLVIEAGTTVSSMGVILIPVMLAALCCVYSMIYKKMKVCFEMMLCLLPCFLQIIMFYFMRW